MIVFENAARQEFKIFVCLKLFFIFFYYFNMLILKINFKKYKNILF
jgi:hypothetical protein